MGYLSKEKLLNKNVIYNSIFTVVIKLYRINIFKRVSFCRLAAFTFYIWFLVAKCILVERFNSMFMKKLAKFFGVNGKQKNSFDILHDFMTILCYNIIRFEQPLLVLTEKKLKMKNFHIKGNIFPLYRAYYLLSNISRNNISIEQSFQ